MPRIAAPRPIVARPATRRRRLTAAVASLALVAGSAVVTAAEAAPASAAVAGFTAGDVVVYRVGTGAAALSSAGTAVSLDEYSSTGSVVQSVALPTTASGTNKPLVASGSAGSEGLLTLSGDGRYLVATGYSAAVGTSGVSGSAAKSVPRTVARVDASDAVDTSTALADAADGNNVRSAATQDGSGFWIAGAAGGVRYAPLGAGTSTQLTTTAVNLRQVEVVDGQLYVSGDPTKTGATTVATVGTGLPTTAGQAVTNLIPTTKSPQPYAYSLLTLGSGSAPDTLYLADNGNGAVAKYSLVNGTWTATGSVNLTGVAGVTANDVKGVVTVYATTPTGLYTITDSSGAGGTLSGSATQIATAQANTAFRGVAFAPGTTIGSGGAPPANPAPTVTAANAGLPAALGDSTVPSTTLTLADPAYPADQLTVVAASSDQTIARNSGISITGTGATRTLAVTPAGASGKATITVTVTAPDGQSGTTSITFGVSPDLGNSTARYYSGAGNASAAIDVGNGYAIVGDDESNVLRLYNLGRSGPPVKTFDFTGQLPFATTEIDIEAAARRGDTIYWEGSMSNTSGGNLAPSRSTVFATTVSGTGAGTTLTYAGAYTGLRADLLAWDHANNDALGLTASGAGGVGGHDATGLNLEGMEFAGTGSTLYLSFRAPLEPTINRHLALLVPLTNVAADIAAGPGVTGTSSFGAPVELNLGGLGVRDIRQNADGQYLISAGTADDSNTGFVLYYWDGNPADDPQPTGTTLPQLPAGTPGSWETIVSTPEPLVSGASLELIQDDGGVTWYGDGLTTKTGMLPDLQKSVGLTFTYTAPAARASLTVLAADSASSVAGAGVTYTATVTPATGSGTPTGTVEFSDGGTDVSGCGARPITQGTATCTVGYTTVGGHMVTATYSGDGTYAPSTSTAVTHSVTAAGLDHLVVSPATASQPAGSAQPFTVEGYDAYGNDVGDITASSTFAIAPTSGTASGASCTAGGSCTATTPGSYTVTASNTSGAGKPVTGNATFTVVAAAAATLAVSPAGTSITAGGSQAFTARGVDRYGNDTGPVSATFTISPNGTGTGAACTSSTCTATRAGTYTVTATGTAPTGGTAATGTARLTITSADLDHLVLAPPTRTVAAGVAQPFTAEGFDTYGNDRGDVTAQTTFTITGAGTCAGATCAASDGGAHTVTGRDGAATGTATLTTTTPPMLSAISPSRGTTLGGTTVTIRGTGLTGTRQVYFGDTLAPRFTVGSDSTLSVVTPAHAAGAEFVRVVADTGSSDGGPVFTFVTPPPIVTGISPTSGSTTGGTVVTVTGTGFTGVQYVYFGTVRVSAFHVLSGTRLTVVAPAQGHVTRHVVVRTPAGYSTTVLADEYTWVTAPPTVGAIAPASGPTTGGTVVTVTGTGFTGVQYVYFGTVRVSAFHVLSGTRLTVVAPAQGPVTRHVVVRTPAGYSRTVFADEFTYRAR